MAGSFGVRMNLQKLLHEKQEWTVGVAVGIMSAVTFLLFWGAPGSPPSIPVRPFRELQMEQQEGRDMLVRPLPIQLNKEVEFPIPVPDLQSHIFATLVPPPPGSHLPKSARLVIGAKSLQVSLPAQVGLAFREEGELSFSEGDSQRFLIEVGAEIPLQGTVVVDGRRSQPFFFAAVPLVPTSVDEISADSPVRKLAGGRWWGYDLLVPQETIYKIELGDGEGGALVELRPAEILVWKNQQWIPSPDAPPTAGGPIAKIAEDRTEEGLLLDVWDQGEYSRLLLPKVPFSPIGAKPEELFSAVRIRSEKQMSCHLDRQCLILRPGDWVLREEGRWHVLRTEEERGDYLSGKRKGELFILREIAVGGSGEKKALGSLFSATRTHEAPLQIAAQSSIRKNGAIVSRRGQ
jgi:hypothetical protein